RDHNRASGVGAAGLIERPIPVFTNDLRRGAERAVGEDIAADAALAFADVQTVGIVRRIGGGGRVDDDGVPVELVIAAAAAVGVADDDRVLDGIIPAGLDHRPIAGVADDFALGAESSIVELIRADAAFLPAEGERAGDEVASAELVEESRAAIA